MRTALQWLALIAVANLPPCAVAQTWPTPGKPIRIVIPQATGGVVDIQSRAIAKKMAEAMSHPVIVDNKPGGTTVIGAREVVAAAPDGHTLLYTGSAVVMLPHLMRTPPYDLFKDFTPITMGSRVGFVLAAHVSVPASNLRELVAYAKNNPGKLSYASVGTGSPAHLYGELLSTLAGIKLVHVPYKGGSASMTDLMGGHLHLAFDGPTTAIQAVSTGKVKLLAAATEARIAALPELATMREQGYEVGITGWIGFFAPGGTPAAIVDRLYPMLARAIQDPENRALFARGGTEASGMPVAEFVRQVHSHHERWGEVIRKIGVKLDQ